MFYVVFYFVAALVIYLAAAVGAREFASREWFIPRRAYGFCFVEAVVWPWILAREGLKWVLDTYKTLSSRASGCTIWQ